MRHPHFFLLPFSIILPAAAPAAVPVRWTVETSRAQPAAFEQYAGTEIALEASLTSYGRPLAVEGEPRLYWQTNGMGAAWWSAPASASGNVLRAAWTPAMETGARAYSCFVGVPGSVYSAAFRLRLLPSPGAVPNELPLPARRIDFAAVEVANAPWLAEESDPTVPAATNALAKALRGEIEAARPADYEAVKAKANSALQPAATNGLATAASVSSLSSSLSTHTASRSNPHGVTAAQVGAYTKAQADAKVSAATNGLLRTESDPTVPAWAKAARKPTYTASEVGAADAGEVASLQGDVQTLGVGYERVYGFVSGATNANFSATNYPPTQAEADARRRFAPEPGMDFSDVPASLQLNEFRDGAWRTVVDARDWTVWYFAFREARLTNEIARLAAENAALSNRLERARAWADTTASGAENPMGDTVVVDRPNMWLMAGYEWQKCVSGSNRCFVIRAKGAALAAGSGEGGFLEVADAFGRPYMRVNKTADSFADPVVDEISFDAEEGAWYVVFGNSQRPARGGANAALDGDGAGEAILYAEDDPRCPAEITWPERPDSVAGHWIMRAVPKPVGGAVPETMFFGAERITVAGQDYVEYLKEASFGAGVRVGTNVYDAVESGDTLTWRRRK